MYYLYGVFICLSCVKLVDLVENKPTINPSVEELYISTMKSKTEFLKPIKRCEIVEASDDTVQNSDNIVRACLQQSKQHKPISL